MYTTSCGSTVVTHLSTRQTDSGLTSQIGRDAVLFTTYGRIQRLRERNTGIERRVKNEKKYKGGWPIGFLFFGQCISKSVERRDWYNKLKSKSLFIQGTSTFRLERDLLLPTLVVGVAKHVFSKLKKWKKKTTIWKESLAVGKLCCQRRLSLSISPFLLLCSTWQHVSLLRLLLT